MAPTRSSSPRSRRATSRRCVDPGGRPGRRDVARRAGVSALMRARYRFDRELSTRSGTASTSSTCSRPPRSATSTASRRSWSATRRGHRLRGRRLHGAALRRVLRAAGGRVAAAAQRRRGGRPRPRVDDGDGAPLGRQPARGRRRADPPGGRREPAPAVRGLDALHSAAATATSERRVCCSPQAPTPPRRTTRAGPCSTSRPRKGMRRRSSRSPPRSGGRSRRTRTPGPSSRRGSRGRTAPVPRSRPRCTRTRSSTSRGPTRDGGRPRSGFSWSERMLRSTSGVTDPAAWSASRSRARQNRTSDRTAYSGSPS